MDALHMTNQLRRRRLIPLAIAIATVLVAISLPGAARAQTLPELTHPAAQRAMQDHLTYQGECWPWIRQIVQESMGRTIGFGYVSGFYEAGATEVPLSEAQQGDVIQIADDENAGPGVDYPGLHTGLVLERFDDGTFTIIDSNSQWDGVVRIRYGYDPIASANRYSGLEVHAYRIPTDGEFVPIPPTEAPEPETFSVGDTAVVTPGGGCLNLRSDATLAGSIVTCLPEGAELTVLSEPVEADGWAWVAVHLSDGAAGWVASEYLSQTASVAPAAELEPEPDEEPEPEPVYRRVIPLLAVS